MVSGLASESQRLLIPIFTQQMAHRPSGGRYSRQEKLGVPLSFLSLIINLEFCAVVSGANTAIIFQNIPALEILLSAPQFIIINRATMQEHK